MVQKILPKRTRSSLTPSFLLTAALFLLGAGISGLVGAKMLQPQILNEPEGVAQLEQLREIGADENGRILLKDN